MTIVCSRCGGGHMRSECPTTGYCLPKMSSRHISSDLEYNIERQKIADDETCIALSNVARVAAIKLLGSMSRDAYIAKKLSEPEIDALNHLYVTLQT